MTLDEMYTMMELYGFDDFEDSQKLLLLNESYFEVVTREPWPFMEHLAIIDVPNGSTQITNNSYSGSPTDVNSVTSFIDMTHNIIMMPERNDTIEKKYQSEYTMFRRRLHWLYHHQNPYQSYLVEGYHYLVLL